MTKRQKSQLELAFGTVGKGEARSPAIGGTEAMAATTDIESPTVSGPSMEAIVERDNLRQALKRVRRNKGAPGVDGMTVDELGPYLKDHWSTIRSRLMDGSYRAPGSPSAGARGGLQPVKRVEIPKAGGGVRALGIPTVLDRFIQQAVLQVLQPAWDPTFSAASYGFRPGRSAHQAVARAQEHIAAGHGWVVDLDLEKFFDRVDHDILMGLVAKRVADRRVLRLVRGFLTAGVLAGGLVGPTDEGTPQGGPLSPLLSNLMLDVLDKELARRGHRFVRYADDCNIYVRSRRSGERVMASVTRFVTDRLRLRVNMAKSAVDQPSRRKFPVGSADIPPGDRPRADGFSFTAGKAPPRRRIAPQALRRFQERVRELTRRPRGPRWQAIGVGGKGDAFSRTIEKLRTYLNGWAGYYGFCETPSVLRRLDQWVRRRLRAIAWRQWRNGWNRFEQLFVRNVPRRLAAQTASSAHGPWRIAASPALNIALSNSAVAALGLPSLTPVAA